ncbi:hypothetical protein, partial [Lysinibacillus xylanilyticus]|uniref:hypothetical protein n=1 Tax=Lysinibacillus xylanilyticus TaxID=582475 RepID=UPI003CFFCFDB
VAPGNLSVAFAFLSVTSAIPSVASFSFRRFEDFIRRSGESFRRFRSSIRLFGEVYRRPFSFRRFIDFIRRSKKSIHHSDFLQRTNLIFLPKKYSQHVADYKLIDMDVWFLFAGILYDQCLWTIY